MGMDGETAELTVSVSDLPTVSVVIPAYGHRNFIGRTLDSVFAQTWTDYEIIVVNDGSPDDTEAVLQPFIDAGKIRYVKQENAGVAAARNRGIELARGEFIALLDDDDLWPPNKLASQVAMMRANPSAVMVYGKVAAIDPDDAPYMPLDWSGSPWCFQSDGPDTPGPSGQVFEAFITDNWIVSPGLTLIRRSTLIEMGEPPLDTSIWGNDDWDLWLRLADRGDILYQSELMLYYRFHGDNASRNALRMTRNLLKLIQKHRNRQRDCPERFQLLTAKYEGIIGVPDGWLMYATWRAHQQGALRDGLINLIILARLNPRVCMNRKYYQMLKIILEAMLRKDKRKTATLTPPG